MPSQIDSDILPANSGQNLGSHGQPWNVAAENLDVSGTVTLNGTASASLLGPFKFLSEGNTIGGTTPAAVTATTLQANTNLKVASGGTAITQIMIYSQTLTPISVGAATAAEQNFTVTGLTVTDKVIVNPAATGNATMVGAARVSGANIISIQFCNPTAGALTPGAGTYNIIAIRS